MAPLHRHTRPPDHGAVQRRPAKAAQPQAEDGTTQAQHPLLQLQRQLGNRQVQGLLAQRSAQSPLTALTGMPATIQAQAVPMGPEEEKATQAAAEEEELQMAATAEEEEVQMAAEEEEVQAAAEEEELQMAAAPEEEELQAAAEEDELQMAAQEEESQMAAASSAPARRPSNITARIHAQRGAGSALDGATLQRMSAAFGQSFDHVRIHADGAADELARDLGAKAFTNQHDIFFRSGLYQPGTPQGDKLIAHELTHVIQQERGLVPTGHQSAGGRDTGDVFEQEAAATADALVSGEPLPGATPATASIQREPRH